MEFIKVKGDINGNPRYVTHFFSFLTEEESYSSLSIDEKYKLALNRAKQIGGKKYNNKQFGGGIIFQSYNIKDTENKINNLLNQ